jgi:Acetyltransferase (GNAT) domain
MTLANGTDRLRLARLLLRRIRPDDLTFFMRLHALPEVAQGLYPEGRPRTSEEMAAWLQRTLASYEQLSLGHLAVEREADGVLVGRCCGCLTRSRPSFRTTPARAASPNDWARQLRGTWTWTGVGSTATCGRWQRATKSGFSRRPPDCKRSARARAWQGDDIWRRSWKIDFPASSI